MLEAYVKENYHARFPTCSYQYCRETHCNSRLDIKCCQSQWSVKCRSRVPDHYACLKSMSRAITMQAFILAATNVLLMQDAEKHILVLDST